MSAGDAKRNPVRVLLSAIASMRTALVAFALVVAASILGSLLPSDPGVWRANPVLSALDSALSLSDVYRSWWFVGLLALLCASTAVCAARQLAGALRFRGSPAAILAKWSRWAAHPAMLLVAAGGLVGAIGGFRATVTFPEGGRAGLPADALPGHSVEVGAIDVRVERHPDGRVSDWISELVVFVDAKDEGSKAVKVNDPAIHRGLHFLQASYGRELAISYRAEGDAEWRRGVFACDRPHPLSPDGAVAIAFSAEETPDAATGAPSFAFALVREDEVAETGRLVLGEARALATLPVELRLEGERELTSILVTRDPGLPLVWAGLALGSLSAIGLFAGRSRPARDPESDPAAADAPAPEDDRRAAAGDGSPPIRGGTE